MDFFRDLSCETGPCVNMLGDILIDYKYLEKNVKNLQNKIFIVVGCEDDCEIWDKIQSLFPDSNLDFVDDEGWYVFPKK